jgi:Uma2 family endonuclease
MPPEPITRLSVEQYHEMIRAGILDEDEPVELLEGWLVTKMAKKPPHTVATKLAHDALGQCVPAGWHVRAQEPITTDTSEPEPDLSVPRGDVRIYLDRHPGPKDVGLVAEVADSSLDRDRGWKKRIYARARIPVYWIINLIDDKIEVYTDPTGPARKPDYRVHKDYGPSDQVPVVIDGKVIARLKVRDLLP